jgi:RimJ/RimL family protein N-acetyltransferase
VTVAETERLVLRLWRPADAEPLAAINADPLVMRFLGGPLSRAQSDAALDRMAAQWAAIGYGRCAVEDRATGELLGYCGLSPHGAIENEIEIGWRLASHCWRRGYATEAARAMRDLAFGRYGLPRLVSVALPENAASLGVMRNIGMRHWKDVEYDGMLLTVYAMPATTMTA